MRLSTTMAKSVNYADHYKPMFGIPWVPVLPDAQLAAMSDEQLAVYTEDRLKTEQQAIANPVANGWTLPMWDRMMANWDRYVIHVMLGGNQSGKSIFGSRMITWLAGTIPEAETYCWHVSEKRSIDDQQRFIYEALPPSVKNLRTKKGVNHSTQYSQKNGFTDSICILPPQPGCRRGGSINFFNYAQYQQNDQIIEGIKAHGVWCDEKVPLALLDTLKYRLFTYHGRLLLTYTVIDGWNDTIEKILAKTKTIEKRYSERLKMHLPVVQESLSMDSCCIYYAWTDDNPFTDAKEFWKLNATSDKATILARAYGIPTKSIAGAFPAFSREVNVIPHENLPWIKAEAESIKIGKKPVPYKVTRYMAIDPAGSKNWFMLWVAIDAGGTWWVYREWPDYDDWALPGSTVEGKPGPAQKGTGKGIKEYVELIKTAEDDEVIYERYIDPRMGAAEKQSQDGATTIISDLDEAEMIVLPASGVDIVNGLQGITNLLAWDESKPRDSMNSPHLFVSDRCQNLIYSLAEHTAKGSAHEATKDPIDCFDPETEILTRDGWVPFPQLPVGVEVATLSVSGNLEFQMPTEYHDLDYTGDMVCAESQSLDFKVTPNHRMLVYPQRPKLKIRLASELCRQDTIPSGCLGIRDEPVSTIEIWAGKYVAGDDWAEFIGWYVAEGSATGTNGGAIQMPGRGYSVYICQSHEANPEKCARIADLLVRLGLHAQKTKSGFIVSSKQLWQVVFPLGNQHNRYIPRSVLQLPRKCLERLWEAMVLGDGWRQNGLGHYASISPTLIEGVRELLGLLGKAHGGTYARMPGSGGFIRGREVRGTVPLYMIAERERAVSSLTTKDKRMLVHSVPYSGRVYCVTAPNGTLYVRRNKKPMFAGNCLRYLVVSNVSYFEDVVVDDRPTGVY